MIKSMEGMDKLDGKVSILVDGSGSMSEKLSGKSEMTRFDAACALAILVRELCDDVEIFRFNDTSNLVPGWHGFALRDALGTSNGSTNMWGAVKDALANGERNLMIVITDEQTQDNRSVAFSESSLLVVINVAGNQNGVGYGKNILHINGWSENVVQYLREYLGAKLS